MKATLTRLLRETLEAIRLETVLPQRVQLIGSVLSVDGEQLDLDAHDRIVIAALGKAAWPMTAALTKLLAPRSIEGIAVAPAEPETTIAGIAFIRGEHPYPDGGSLRGAQALLEKIKNLGQRDLLIYLLSGGGSSLAECPCDSSVSLADVSELNRLLVTSGVNIVEINVVRKHLSAIKAGRLAAAAAPARQITLFVSDVPADQPSAVASGPTMPDQSTVGEVTEILERYNLIDRLPGSIRRLIDEHRLQETPKPGDAVFARSSWHCLLDNQSALDVLRARAQGLGWLVETDCSVDDWPLPDAVNALMERLHGLAAKHPGRTVCLLSGGELSCPVTGNGTGGRNQAFVLHAAQKIGAADVTVLSVGTDGIDGNSPAAGAIADSQTMGRAVAAGLSAADYEQRSDAYNFFDALDDVIVTGPTGNNVRDLRMLIKR